LTKDADVQVASGGVNFPTWEPRALGLPKAIALAVLLVAAIIIFCIWTSVGLPPYPQPQTIQVTEATLTQLPQPTPPPPPKVVPPPKPLPAVIPKPAPVQSKIVVATKPPPPIHHIYKPIPHPVINHTPPPPTPAPVSQAPQPPAAEPTSGIGPYGSAMHDIIQANQNVPPALAQLGLSGTAVVHIVVGPDGHVISATIAQSSGNGLVDQTALDHARNATFPAYNNEMPDKPLGFDIPIEIQPADQ
jgi:protein TonB